MKPFMLVLALFSAININAQQVIKGKVVDKEKNQPISRASIFLNNTSIGTVSNDQGIFELQVPQGKFELIVSSIGYETYYKLIISGEETELLIISLTLRTEELENIVITPYEKDGYAKWGKLFIDHFIGTRSEAADCRIKNIKALRFRHDKSKNELLVNATEPLIIENKALGYTLVYDLVQFSYNFKSRLLLFTGFPFFEEMKGSSSAIRRWEKKRKDVFLGSQMHFMRALYRNQLLENGFEVRRLTIIENSEKERVRRLLAARKFTPDVPMDMFFGGDSSRYYSGVLKQEDNTRIYGKDILSGDSIAFAFDSLTAGMDFENHLHITYTIKEAPQEYQRSFPRSGSRMMSEISLLNGKPIEIKNNGMYYQGTDLMNYGYWAWSEKISAMLPYDYILNLAGKR
jgi:hypothetical protein